MEYRDETHYTYTCMQCSTTLYENEKPEDHILETGHGEFIVIPSIIRKYIMNIKMKEELEK